MTIGSGPDEDVIAALADPTRRLLLDRLSTRDGATATVLGAQLPISRQAVVKHLSVLEGVGLVGSYRAGRERRYQVRPGKLAHAAEWMNRLACQWEARLEAIKRLAENTGE